MSNGLLGAFSSSSQLLPGLARLTERTQPPMTRPLRCLAIAGASPLPRTGPSPPPPPAPSAPPPCQGLPHSEEPVRQHAPPRYSVPCGCCRLGSSLSPPPSL